MHAIWGLRACRHTTDGHVRVLLAKNEQRADVSKALRYWSKSALVSSDRNSPYSQSRPGLWFDITFRNTVCCLDLWPGSTDAQPRAAFRHASRTPPGRLEMLDDASQGGSVARGGEAFAREQIATPSRRSETTASQQLFYLVLNLTLPQVEVALHLTAS
ncbi:hypothetical protein SVAN01_10550 [Stagonosporopsis vannaccii]|nr:hypothetical protein SVAN01_10550 [Stagonosporopsis vannaccii]